MVTTDKIKYWDGDIIKQRKRMDMLSTLWPEEYIYKLSIITVLLFFFGVDWEEK